MVEVTSVCRYVFLKQAVLINVHCTETASNEDAQSNVNSRKVCLNRQVLSVIVFSYNIMFIAFLEWELVFTSLITEILTD